MAITMPSNPQSRLALLVCLVLWPNLAAGQQALERRLDLGTCIRLAVQNNLGLTAQRLSRQQAELEANRQVEAFWPVLFFDGGIREERVPVGGTGPAGETSATWTYNSGVEVFTPLGTSLSASLTNARRGTSDQTVLFDPEHHTRLAFRLNQPILRGAGIEVNTADLVGSRLSYSAAVESYRSHLNSLIGSVELAYWDLFFAQQDLASKERSLALARKQYEDTAENIRRGLLPDHDIYVVEENLVLFQRKQRDSLDLLEDARSNLAERMQLDPADAGRLVVSERPDPARVDPGAQADLLEVGLRSNPALASERALAEVARVRLAFEENARLPRLDLEASLDLNGVTDDLGSTWSQVGALENREAYLGLRVDLPVFRLIDDSGEARARLEVQRRLVRLKQTEAELTFAVSNLRRDILHRLETYRLARRVSRLARKKLAAQQEKYEAGVAALKDLVQFLRELDEAELEQLRSLVGLAKGFVDLHLAVGDLHRLRGVHVQ